MPVPGMGYGDLGVLNESNVASFQLFEESSWGCPLG
jgi:hypothetical protein